MAQDAHKRRFFLFIMLASVTGACAVPPVSPNGPRRNEPPYPVLLTENPQRAAAASVTWAQLLNQEAAANLPAIALRPVTATIQNLPDNLGALLYLPKVGTETQMSEEQTRESLRRFLSQSQKLIGADPAQLSLVQQITNADGSQTVVYDQRAFSYPLRGGYGRLELRFAFDRRVLSLSSTAIPDADKIQAALNVIKPTVKEDELSKQVTGHAFTYSDSAANKQTYTISSGNQINVKQLVVYPVLSSARSGVLEFHLAWEVGVTNAPVALIYVDAVKGDVIVASSS
jgi:hypothetical protein